MKQLRERFSPVRKGLERGEQYLLLYRSQPLALISPYDKNQLPADQRPQLTSQLLKKTTGVSDEKRPISQSFLSNNSAPQTTKNSTINNQPETTKKKTDRKHNWQLKKILAP